jgi:hypothetical protein
MPRCIKLIKTPHMVKSTELLENLTLIMMDSSIFKNLKQWSTTFKKANLTIITPKTKLICTNKEPKEDSEMTNKN